MAYELMVGLNVIDQAGYQAYRDAMGPILAEHGGGFRYDFMIATVLKSEAPHPVNRVFALGFKDKQSKEAFFSNADYRQVRAKLFEPSVNGSTIIAAYTRAE